MSNLEISSSSLQQFGQCRKAYELGYEMLLDPNIKSEAMEKGTDFHKFMESYWKWQRWNMSGRIGEKIAQPTVNDSDEMAAVCTEYLLNNVINEGGHLSQIQTILLVEEPFYIEIIPGVSLRYTPDLVWRDLNDWIVLTDYKTFSVAATWKTELDYQGRLGTAFGKIAFPASDVRFEWRKVRSWPPSVPHNKKGELWALEDCYPAPIEMQLGDIEIETVWGETQQKARDLIAAHEARAAGDKYAFYRHEPGWKSGIGSCANCLYRELCALDMQGILDSQSAALHSTPRKPLKQKSPFLGEQNNAEMAQENQQQKDSQESYRADQERIAEEARCAEAGNGTY